MAGKQAKKRDKPLAYFNSAMMDFFNRQLEKNGNEVPDGLRKYFTVIEGPKEVHRHLRRIGVLSGTLRERFVRFCSVKQPDSDEAARRILDSLGITPDRKGENKPK